MSHEQLHMWFTRGHEEHECHTIDLVCGLQEVMRSKCVTQTSLCTVRRGLLTSHRQCDSRPLRGSQRQNRQEMPWDAVLVASSGSCRPEVSGNHQPTAKLRTSEPRDLFFFFLVLRPILCESKLEPMAESAGRQTPNTVFRNAKCVRRRTIKSHELMTNHFVLLCFDLGQYLQWSGLPSDPACKGYSEDYLS